MISILTIFMIILKIYPGYGFLYIRLFQITIFAFMPDDDFRIN